MLEKVVEAAMQVEEDLPDPEKNLPHSETEVQTKPQKKKVTFSLRKKKSVENSKKRKLLNEGNSEIEQVIGKRQRKKTKRLIEEDDLDEEDVEKQCR